MAKPTLLVKARPNTSLEDALSSLEEASFLQPPLKTIIHIANRCCKERNLSCSLRLYSYIQKMGLEAHDILGNHLVSMLVEVGSMDKAQIVFNQLSLKTESTWDSLIKGYISCGQSRWALALYHRMQEDSLCPAVRTFVVLLKACGQLKDVERGSQIHSQISEKGLLKSDVFVGSALIDMYAKCGLLKKAHEVFEELPHRDVVVWNALIGGYAKHEFGEQALDCFRQMQLEGVTPNAITFTCCLKACGSIGAICHGEDIHAEIDRQGLLTKDPVLGSALVDMYARCGFLEKAQKVFRELSVRSVGACNALIAGYIKHNHSEEALNFFEQMLLQDVYPDAITYICALKACCNIRALARGRELHVEIDKRGFLKQDPVVGSTLVDMYVKCGSLAKAREVFDELPIQTVVSWNSLLSGYVEHEHGAEALRCLEQMDSDGVSPNVITYICGLKACGIIRATDKGLEIHSEIARNLLMREDIYVGSTLVDMYAKCGWLAKAKEVFSELPFRNVVAWNALIGGYAKQERDYEALVCFEQMQGEGVSPDAITFTCSLKACGSMGATDKGREIHAEIARKGLLDTDSLLGSSLVDMYAGCGLLSKALAVFEKLPAQNLDAWNSLISGYVDNECNEEALLCFEQMLDKGVSPDAVTLIFSLKACGSIRAANKGRKMHVEIERKGLMGRDLVGCALVDMYSKCGLLEEAHEVFGKLSVQNTGSWNALIAGHVNQEHGEKALYCFHLMQIKGVDPDAITYACTLKACGSIGVLDKGIELHKQIIRDQFLETNFMVGNALVDMYAKCGLLIKAQEVFEKLLDKDVVSWNGLIGGYVKHNKGEEALFYFEEMQHEGISPDVITFTSILKACGIIGSMDKAREVHAEIERRGLLEIDFAIGNAVVDMYAKCCSFVKAKEVFRKLPSRDVVSWNVLIGGYARHDYGHESLDCFEQMQIEGISPDATTFACSLKACGSIGAINKGRKIHAEIEREGLLGKDDIVGNALIYMYAKCGSLAKAQDVFDDLPSKSAVSWNALIAAYTTCLHGEQALKCFEGMQHEGVSPNSITFLCSLKACGSIAAFDKGSCIHADVERQGLLEVDGVIGNALVDMYAKCGTLTIAEEVFERLSHDILSWNALIGGYAQLGESEVVFKKIDRMIGEGIDPNEITYISILNACSHAGLVEEAQIYCDAMIQVFGITPIAEHHTCMIDLLGRAGQEERAMALMMEIPFHPDIVMWCAILGACRKWNNVELAQQAFEQVVGLDGTEAALYICMYNIYADADAHEHVELNA